MNTEKNAAGVASGGENNADESNNVEMVTIIDNSKPYKSKLYPKESNGDILGTEKQGPVIERLPSDPNSGMIPCGVLMRTAITNLNMMSGSLQRYGGDYNASPVAEMPAGGIPGPMQNVLTPAVPVYTSLPPPSVPALCSGWGQYEVPINATVDIISIVKCESDADSFYCCRICCNGKIYTKEIPIKDFVFGQWVWGIPEMSSLAKSKAETSKQLFRYLNSKVAQGAFQTEYLLDRPGWRVVEGKHFYGTPDGVIGSGMIPNARSKTGQRIQVEPVQYVGNVKGFLGVEQLTPTHGLLR